MRGSCKIDAPNTEPFLADLAPRNFGVCLEPIGPVPERTRVVLAQRLAIDELESFRRKSLDHARDLCELTAGKDVFLDEIADAAAEARRAEPVVGDAVVENEAAGLEHAPNLAEV